MMHHAEPGQSVSVLFYVDGRPHALRGNITSTSPFAIETGDKNAAHFESPTRAVLIIQKGNEFSKAEAELRSSGGPNGWALTASSFGWEKIDRRRFSRYEIELPATVRAVIESSNGAELKYVECSTIDVSYGGAWLKSDSTLDSGLLVEFQTEIEGRPVRVLSVVRWADTGEKDGFGVEFIDFVGGSRQTLHALLSRAA